MARRGVLRIPVLKVIINHDIYNKINIANALRAHITHVLANHQLTPNMVPPIPMIIPVDPKCLFISIVSQLGELIAYD